jgi:hypothetical protein
VTAALVAAAVHAELPARSLPSLADFSDPGLTEPTRLTVTDDGRVFGHLACWGVCHIGVDGYCQEPPVSDTNYAYFATGHVETDGGLVAVGPLTMGTGHASTDPAVKWRTVVAHYDDTGTVIADVAVGNDSVGIWLAGRLRPSATPEQVYALRAAGSVSGDWRPIGTCSELVAALVVNVPGFPIPAPSLAASAAGMTLVAAGVVRPEGVSVGDARIVGELSHAEVVKAVVASLRRGDRASAAARRLRASQAARAAARIESQAARARRERVTAAAARLDREG